MTSQPLNFLGQTATIGQFRAHKETVVSEPVEERMRKPNTGICNAAVIISVCVHTSLFLYVNNKKIFAAPAEDRWGNHLLCVTERRLAPWLNAGSCPVGRRKRKAGRWEVDPCSLVSTRGLWWGVFAARWSRNYVKCQNPKAESTAAASRCRSWSIG